MQPFVKLLQPLVTTTTTTTTTTNYLLAVWYRELTSANSWQTDRQTDVERLWQWQHTNSTKLPDVCWHQAEKSRDMPRWLALGPHDHVQLNSRPTCTALADVTSLNWLKKQTNKQPPTNITLIIAVFVVVMKITCSLPVISHHSDQTSVDAKIFTLRLDLGTVWPWH